MKKLIDNKYKAVVVGIVSLMMITAGMVAAQGQGFGKSRGLGQGSRLERMATQLNLTEQQQETIETLQEKSRQEGMQLRKGVARLKNELKGEMLKDDPSEKTVLSLNEKMGALKTDLKAIQLKTRLAIREQLTPEQRDQMLTMRGQGHGGEGRFEGRRGGGKFGRGMGKGDGTGPRAHADCPQKNQ